jgi:hypothetical protein
VSSDPRIDAAFREAMQPAADRLLCAFTGLLEFKLPELRAAAERYRDEQR